MVKIVMFGLTLMLGGMNVVNAECTFENTSCKIVCDNIRSGHPGHQAAQVAVDNYDNCSLSPPVFALWFTYCKFPNNTLDVNWFEPATSGPIRPFSHLYFELNDLFIFEDGAVATPESFKHSLEKFEMNFVHEFPVVTAGLLQGLINLSTFQFASGNLGAFEAGVLSPVADTLQTLILRGNNPDMTTILANATGICQTSTFPRLSEIYITTVVFQYGIPVLSSKMFTGINSNGINFKLSFTDIFIEFFEDNTVFEKFGSQLQFLNLEYNSIRTVPNGLFDKFQQEGAVGLQVFFENNPWHCDCHLQYLQDILRNTGDDIEFYDFIVCASPSSQAGISIITADLTTECQPLELPAVQINCSKGVPSVNALNYEFSLFLFFSVIIRTF